MFSPLIPLTNTNQNYANLPPLDMTFQYRIPATPRREHYSPYTHSRRRPPSWSPSEPTWTNSPRRSYFGRYSSHEPWRSPVLLLPALPEATTPTKVKENRYRRQQQRQKRNPSNSFSSPSMPKTNLHARQHGSPAQSPFEIHCQMLNGGLPAALFALLRSDPSGSLGRLVSSSVHQLIGLGISASEMEENPSQFNRSSTSLVQ